MKRGNGIEIKVYVDSNILGGSGSNFYSMYSERTNTNPVNNKSVSSKPINNKSISNKWRSNNRYCIWSFKSC